MTLGKRILEWVWPTERRQTRRRTALPLVAYFWDGAEPKGRKVSNVSPHGMYLLTDNRWYPNTLVTMSLTRTDLPQGAPNRSICVMSRVVRSGADGVGVEFVWSEGIEETAAVSDKKAVKEFFEALPTHSHVLNIARPAELHRRTIPLTRNAGLRLTVRPI